MQDSGVMIPSVKKLLLILLLAAVPFQFAWSAAAAYCQHEQGAAVQHFGHHAHQRQQQGADESAGHAGKLPQLHQDCGYCHAVNPASMPAMASMPSLPPGSVHAEPPVVSFTSHIPEGPREPDRFVA